MMKSPDSRGVEVRTRCLTDDPQNNSMMLGCYGCPQFRECGGLFLEESIFDCLAHCCGGDKSCTQVCPNAAARFVEQRFEIDGFLLDNVARAPVLGHVADLDIVELVYHGSKRIEPLNADAVAVRLYDLIDYRRGRCKYATRAAMCAALKISPAARIIVSGVDHDAHIEPWWRLGHERRQCIIPALRVLGIELITTPNFSVVIDVPRTDNLHAMKRIAIIFAEFQQHGIPCALHPNARTERDFRTWSRFIAARPEVESIAYEFITGPGLVSRREFHLEMLAMLASEAGRPLDLVVRGDPGIVPFLRERFRNVVYIDTTAFVKTMKRQKAKRAANSGLDWSTVLTPKGAPLDERFQYNHDEQIAYLRSLYFGAETYPEKAA